MSFDVFAQAFRYGESATANAIGARAVMSTVHYSHNPRFNSYVIQFADGSGLEMYARGLGGGEKPFDGAMFALRGFTKLLAISYSSSRAQQIAFCSQRCRHCVSCSPRKVNSSIYHEAWLMTFR